MDHNPVFAHTVCPVCCASQPNLSLHLASHSKDEIIYSLTLGNSRLSDEAQTNVSINSGSSSSGIIPTTSSLPCSNVNANITHSNSAVPSSLIGSGGSPLRNHLSSSPSLQPFIAPQFPVAYQSLTNFNENATSAPLFGLVQNAQVNLSTYKSFGPQFGSVPMSSVNQSIMVGASSSRIQPFDAKMDVAANNESVAAARTSSNVPNTISVGQQPVFCILPYNSSIQPTVASGGNFLFYGNNFVGPTSYMPNNTQANLSYVLPTNSFIPNNSVPAHQSFYSIPNFGTKQVVSTNRTLGISVPHTSCSGVSCGQEDKPVFPNGSVYPETGLNEEDNKVIVEVGKNIKITIPKDVLSKKERVKELINKELVRALVINDSEEIDISDSETVDTCDIKNELGSLTTETSVVPTSFGGDIQGFEIPRISSAPNMANVNDTGIPPLVRGDNSSSPCYSQTPLLLSGGDLSFIPKKLIGSTSEPKSFATSFNQLPSSVALFQEMDDNHFKSENVKEACHQIGTDLFNSEEKLPLPQRKLCEDKPSNSKGVSQADDDCSFEFKVSSEKVKTYMRKQRKDSPTKPNGSFLEAVASSPFQINLKMHTLEVYEDTQTSLYQKVCWKSENSESNGTHAEEVMSLKASEILADSDSERASPTEEVDEMFYGKSCIFAGEPGPANLSPGVYVDTKQGDGTPPSTPQLSSAILDEEDGSASEPISLMLDSNCCILPADFIEEDLDEVWSKPLLSQWPKPLEEIKPLITTGIVEDCQLSLSPHASTSGLQNDITKTARDDEEYYDFDYESDCCVDSDSDVSHSHRGILDPERWRCFKCRKNFKSLKEKLLHSGHHSPCRHPSGDKEALQVDNTEMLPPSKLVNVSLKRFRKIPKVEVKIEGSAGLERIDSEVFQCTECSMPFPTVDKLYEHRASVFKSRYICPVCHLEFKRRIDRVKHQKSHPLVNLNCIICNRSFESQYAWSQHQLLHLGLIAYECKECGYKCRRKAELDIHYRKHSGERPFKCDMCSSSFITGHSLKRHVITHMTHQEIECEVCHRKYKNAVGLSKHMLKVHSKKRKFVKKRTDFMCSACNEVFCSEKKLAWHHEVHERWPKKCQQCGECFIHQSNLTKHIRQKHDPSFIPEGNKDNISCPVCNKMYKKSSMVQHMRLHTGDKPYKCGACDKQFAVKCNYLSHKWVHTGIRDRPLKCRYCDRSFHRKRFLESHVRSHKKIRPYTCNDCGKSFIHKNNYRTHVRQHSEDKKHQCEHCGKAFHRKYNLNNHVRIHTGETPYECSECRKQFTQKSNYNVHRKAFHVERHAVREEV